jgi:hypothetical protein
LYTPLGCVNYYNDPFKEKKTKKQTDVTLVMACFVQCGYSLFMFVKTTFMFTRTKEYKVIKPWIIVFIEIHSSIKISNDTSTI